MAGYPVMELTGIEDGHHRQCSSDGMAMVHAKRLVIATNLRREFLQGRLSGHSTTSHAIMEPRFTGETIRPIRENCACDECMNSRNSAPPTAYPSAPRNEYVQHPQSAYPSDPRNEYVQHPQYGMNLSHRMDANGSGDAMPPNIGGRPVMFFRRDEFQSPFTPLAPLPPFLYYPTGDPYSNALQMPFPYYTFPYVMSPLVNYQPVPDYPANFQRMPDYPANFQSNVSAPTDFTINGILGGTAEVGPVAPFLTAQHAQASTPAQPEVVVKEEPLDDGPPPPKRVRGFNVDEILNVENDADNPEALRIVEADDGANDQEALKIVEPDDDADGQEALKIVEADDGAIDQEALKIVEPDNDADDPEALKIVEPDDDADDTEALKIVEPDDDADDPEALKIVEPDDDADDTEVLKIVEPDDDADDPEALKIVEPDDDADDTEMP